MVAVPALELHVREDDPIAQAGPPSGSLRHRPRTMASLTRADPDVRPGRRGHGRYRRPAAIPSAVVASVASSRSSGGRSRILPSVDLRDVPSRIGRPQRPQRAEVAEQRDVVVGGLPEPDARVDDERRPAGRRHARPAQGRPQVGDDLAHDVVVAGLGPVVHHDERHAGARGQLGQSGVRAGAPDVVEQVRAGGQGGLGNDDLGGVDAQRRARAARRETAARTGMTRPISSAASTGAWPGRVDSPPMSRRSAPSSTMRRACSTAAATGSAAPEQPVAGERVGRDVEDAHHERPFAPGERGRTDAGGLASEGVAESSAGSVVMLGRIPELWVVDEARPDGPDKVERPGHDRRPGPAGAHARRAASGSGSAITCAGAARPVAPARAPAPRPAWRAPRRPSSRSRSRPAGRSPRASASTIPSTSLSAIDAMTSVSRTGREVRAQVVEGLGEGRGAGRVVRPVEQDLVAVHGQQLEAPGPRRARIPGAPARGVGRRDPGVVERVEQRVGDGDVRGLVPAAQPDPHRPEPRQLDGQAVAVPAEQRRRPDLGERRRPCAAPAGGRWRAPRRRRRSRRCRRAR